MGGGEKERWRKKKKENDRRGREGEREKRHLVSTKNLSVLDRCKRKLYIKRGSREDINLTIAQGQEDASLQGQDLLYRLLPVIQKSLFLNIYTFDTIGSFFYYILRHLAILCADKDPIAERSQR